MTSLSSTNNNIYQGNLSKIPNNLLRFISTTGECPKQRKTRELDEDKDEQIKPSELYYYGVYDTINHFVNFYYGQSSSNKNKFTELLNKIFKNVLVPWSGNQVINSRGNGLCAYNCLYMFLIMSRPDILNLYDIKEKFTEFKNSVRNMAVEYLDPEIREFMIPLIDDTSTPDLDPIFTSFVNFTGIYILMISINNNEFTISKTKFINDYYPNDHIVIIRNASHLMFLHSNSNYTHREKLYNLIDSNTN